MQLKDKQVLITGGTGFIGSSIANRLINQDIDVSIIDNNNNSLWRIDNVNKCKFFCIDLQNYSEVENTVKKINPDIIFHLAAYVNPERDYDSINKSYNINLNGTKNLILSLNNYSYDLFINTGTCEEYGNIEAPFRESNRESPVSPYSASKIAATYFCEMNAKIYNKPIITVRPFLTYGPKQIARLLIPWLLYSGFEKKRLLLTPCEQTRDFIYIDDLVDAYIKLSEKYKKVNNMGVFNIGSGVEIKIKKVVKLIEKKLKNTEFLIGGKPYRHGETMHFFSSIEKIKKTIKWAPKCSIETGIEKTINWWQKNESIWIRYKNLWD